MNLINFIKTLLPHISKNDILEDIRVTEQEIQTVSLVCAKQAAEQFKISKIQSKESKDLINIFYRNFSIGKSSSTVNIAQEITSRLEMVLTNLKFVQKHIEQTMGSDIVTDGITVKKAVLLRAVDQISFISRFTVDFISVLYDNETKDLNPEEQNDIRVPKYVADKVTKYLALYANLLSVYGNKDFALEDRFDHIPDVILSDKTQEAIVATYGEKNLDPYKPAFLNNFVGNPIYHIRLVVAEWQANRYKTMKDKKKMLEMRLLHLQLLQEKKNDPKLEQEISYIQSRIEKIEYSMDKIEKSLPAEA